MAGNDRQIMPHEARKLLNLNANGKLSQAEIEKAYKTAILFWSQKIVDPLCDHAERDRANDMIKLLVQAKGVLLASAGLSSCNNTTAWNSTPASHAQALQPQFKTSSGMPSFASIKKAFGHVGMAFTYIFKSGVEVYRFACAVPPMCSEIKDFADWILDHASNIGIPKIVVVLLFILGVLALFQGCSEVFGKVSHFFKK